MSQLLEIRERIRTITNLQKVTRAMELVTRTKIARVRQTYLSMKTYHEQLGRLYSSTGHGYLESLEGPTEQVSRILIVVLSQKGFCGAFNNRVLSAARSYLGEQGAAENGCRVIVVGRRNPRAQAALACSFEVVEAPEATSGKNMKDLADMLSAEVEKNPGTVVTVVANRLVSILDQRPVRTVLYPPEPPAGDGEAIREPGAPELFRKLLPEYLLAALERVYWESLAGENYARLISMKNANENASVILDSLRLMYNKTRQGKITQELSEIVSAFDVLRSIQIKRESW